MNVYYRGHSSLLGPTLIQINPVHSLAPRIFKVHFNILLLTQNKNDKFHFAFTKLEVLLENKK
jgi:glycerol uptake facilitator-like aquaporin